MLPHQQLKECLALLLSIDHGLPIPTCDNHSCISYNKIYIHVYINILGDARAQTHSWKAIISHKDDENKQVSESLGNGIVIMPKKNAIINIIQGTSRNDETKTPVLMCLLFKDGTGCLHLCQVVTPQNHSTFLYYSTYKTDGAHLHQIL